MKKSEDQSDDAALADLALAGSPRLVSGPEPALDEIELFRLGRLPEPRRGEVLSHLVHDASCFDQLRALEDADVDLECLAGRAEGQRHRKPLRRGEDHVDARRFRSRSRSARRIAAWGGGLVGALAAALALVAVLPMLAVFQVQYDVSTGYRQLSAVDSLGPADWLGLNRPGAKGLDFQGLTRSAPSDVSLRRAFRAGLRAGLVSLDPEDPGWARIIDRLPRAGPDCRMLDSGCRSRTGAADIAGRWVVMVFAHCQAGESSAAFWNEQERVRRRLMDLIGGSSSRLSGQLDALAGAGDPRERLCTGIGKMLRDLFEEL